MVRKNEKTPDHTELNLKLDRLVQRGRRRMDAIRSMNRDAIRYIFGDQHHGKTLKPNWEYPVINRCYADMKQEVAILSANNPAIATLPREDTDEQTAKLCGEVLKGVWSEELNMRLKVIQSLYDVRLFGVTIAKWLWEPNAEWDDEQAARTGNGWKGKLDVNIVSPEYFGCDPDVELAAEIATKARHLHTERWVDKQWAAQRWPQYRKHLIETGKMSEATGEMVAQGGKTDETGFNKTTYAWAGRERTDLTEAVLQGRLADLILGETKNGQDVERPSMDGMVRVQEIYFRDYATEKMDAQSENWPAGEGEAAHIIKDQSLYYDRNRPVADEAGNPSGRYEQFEGDWPQRETRPEYEKPKYPNGRLVIRLGDDFIAEDYAWEYKRWPFAVTPYSMLPHIWQGSNCVELSKGFQDWMNIIASHMTNYIKYFSDPMYAVEQGALARSPKHKKGTIPNCAGAVLKLLRGGINKIKRFDPVNYPPVVFNMMEFFREADQDLKGVHDVAHGKASGSDNTLGEIQMLNRNTRQRIALQGAFLDVWLKQIALGIIELMQAHLQVGDWVRWSGDDLEVQKAAVQWTEEMASAKYDIAIEPTSTLPHDDEREAAKYFKAYEAAGPAMLEELLKKLKIVNAKEILTRHEIIGPLTKLMEMAQEMGMGPPQLMAAIKAQLQALQATEGPPQQFSGGPAGGGALPPAA